MWWWTPLLGALLATWPASRFTICNLQYIDSFGCSQNLRQLLIFYQEACSNVTNLRGLLKSHLHLQNIPGSFDKTEFLISCKKMFQVWRIEDMQVIFWRVYSILLGVTIQFFYHLLTGGCYSKWGLGEILHWRRVHYFCQVYILQIPLLSFTITFRSFKKKETNVCVTWDLL